MSTLNGKIIPIYIVIACLLMFMDLLFPAALISYYLKFLTTCSLFFISCFQRKRFKEQKLMFTAQLFVVIADYFFVLTRGLKGGQLPPINQVLGTICFLIAYVFLIKAWRPSRLKKITFIEIFIALILLSIYWPTVKILESHLQPLMRIGVFIFGFVLYILAWTGICTRFRAYYGKHTSTLIGLASLLIFISDLAVAHASLNPIFAGRFVPWLSALIWITYVPAWAIIVTIISYHNICN